MALAIQKGVLRSRREDSTDSTNWEREEPAPIKQHKSNYKGVNWGLVSAATFNKTNQQSLGRFLPKCFVPLRQLMSGPPCSAEGEDTGAKPILKSCLRKPAPKLGGPKPFGKSVSFETTATVHTVTNLKLSSCREDLFNTHNDNVGCCYNCRACMKITPLDAYHTENIISIPTLASRLRRGQSKDDDLVDVEESLLQACFNATRMSGEALSSRFGVFMADICNSDKARRRNLHYIERWDKNKVFIKEMRVRRHQGKRITTSQNDMDWLYMTRFAPEIRDTSYNHEYHLHNEQKEIEKIRKLVANINSKSHSKPKPVNRKFVNPFLPKAHALSRLSQVVDDTIDIPALAGTAEMLANPLKDEWNVTDVLQPIQLNGRRL